MKHVLMLVVLLLATGALFAQGMPGDASGGDSTIVNTPKGLFVLRSGVLAKFDAATLKQTQPLLQLFGPAPAAPKDNNDRDAQQKYNADIMRRMAPAIMLVKDNSLLLVIGDGFARINQDTLKTEAMADIKPMAVADAGQGRGGVRMNEGMPSYLLLGNTLYLARNKELLAISIIDGKVTRTELPKELQPLQLNFRNMFGGGNGGGGGNRPGGGNNQPPANGQ